MKLADADVRPYEGLVITTSAQIVADRNDLDFEDVCQLLRLVVAQALVSYNLARAKQPVEKYVFQCVFNRRKDIVKRRRRPEVQMPDFNSSHEREQWEARHLRTEETHYALVEDEPVRLPSTLTRVEVEIVVLMLRDNNQTQIAALLGVSRQKVRIAQRQIEAKLADWEPDRPADSRPVSHLPRQGTSGQRVAA